MQDHITSKATFNQIIEVIVAPNGESSVETKGFQGEACRQASQFLEQALGTKTLEQPTAEYYQQPTAQQTEQQQH